MGQKTGMPCLVFAPFALFGARCRIRVRFFVFYLQTVANRGDIRVVLVKVYSKFKKEKRP